ncbi:MAG: hypothetical protein HY260_10900 [Chloroflexi bacterium]|nr:hypothetical protein [Chloroflexota bacterium]
MRHKSPSTPAGLDPLCQPANWLRIGLAIVLVLCVGGFLFVSASQVWLARSHVSTNNLVTVCGEISGGSRLQFSVWWVLHYLRIELSLPHGHLFASRTACGFAPWPQALPLSVYLAFPL